MPNALVAYARPSDDVSPSAAWTLTAGTPDSANPVTTLGNRRPEKPFKAGSTSATARATFGAPVTLVAIAILNHNLAGAASVVLTSGDGLSVSLTVPANVGGQSVHFLTDLTAEPVLERTSTTFDLAVTTNALGNVAIGEVLLLTAVRDLWVSWGQTLQPDRLVVDQRTFGATSLLYNKRILSHRFTGTVEPAEYEAEMRTLEAEAEGPVHPWLLWPDVTTSRCHYVKFGAGTFKVTRQAPGLSPIPFDLVEVSPGPPLFP